MSQEDKDRKEAPVVENASEEVKELKECFVMMPFGESGNYQAGHFKRVFEYLIKPACKDAGFVARRVDENSKTSIIMLEILEMIVTCDIAICDMSTRNPNVFYELGLRQAFDKKCVLIKDNNTDYPFDVNMLRVVEYDASLRVDLVKSKIQELAQAIRETADSNEHDGNSLVQLLSIKQPAKIPDTKEMGKDMSIILNAIQNLSSKVDNIQQVPNRSLHRTLVLPTGVMARIGEKLYMKGNDLLNEEFGVITNYSNEEVIVRQSNGMSIRLPLSDKKLWDQLTNSEI